MDGYIIYYIIKSWNDWVYVYFANLLIHFPEGILIEIFWAGVKWVIFLDVLIYDIRGRFFLVYLRYLKVKVVDLIFYGYMLINFYMIVLRFLKIKWC